MWKYFTSISFLTLGFRKFKSGCCGANWCRKYCFLFSLHLQAVPPNIFIWRKEIELNTKMSTDRRQFSKYSDTKPTIKYNNCNCVRSVKRRKIKTICHIWKRYFSLEIFTCAISLGLNVFGGLPAFHHIKIKERGSEQRKKKRPNILNRGSTFLNIRIEWFSRSVLMKFNEFTCVHV